MDKKDLRVLMKQKRASLEFDSLALVRQIVLTAEYQNSTHIMIFYPLKNEVNLLSLMEDETKQFYLPRVVGEDMQCCQYNKGDVLEVSKFKTMEPMTEAIPKENINLIIVPALCVDKKNYRLGYGGGFYDRFLNDYRGKTITCIPRELIVETVYPEKYDIPVDLVVSC